MDASHYPSLELCKKLTEAGFPETELVAIVPFNEMEYDRYRKPSVMEMLDELRKTDLRFAINFAGGATNVTVFIWDDEKIFGLDDDCEDTLPNYLGEMILWLHAENYISFSK